MKQNPKIIEEKIDKFNCINFKSGHDKISQAKIKDKQQTAKIFADYI